MGNKNGITLISLVITIVIMLILAGVTISLVIGNNGIFNKSKVAASKYNDSAFIEQVENVWNEYVTDSTSNDINKEITLNDFITYATTNNLLEVKRQDADVVILKNNDKYYDLSKDADGINVVAHEGDVIRREYSYKNGVGYGNWEENTSVNYSDNSAHNIVTRNADNTIRFTCGGSDTTIRAGVIRTNETYDLTSYNTLHIKYNLKSVNMVVDAGYRYLYCGVNTRPMTGWNDNDFYSTETRKLDDATSLGEKEMVIDISKNSGANYIFLQACCINCNITQVWVEE